MLQTALAARRMPGLFKEDEERKRGKVHIPRSRKVAPVCLLVQCHNHCVILVVDDLLVGVDGCAHHFLHLFARKGLACSGKEREGGLGSASKLKHQKSPQKCCLPHLLPSIFSPGPRGQAVHCRWCRAPGRKIKQGRRANEKGPRDNVQRQSFGNPKVTNGPQTRRAASPGRQT